MSKDITDELIIREETSGYSFEKSKGNMEEDINKLIEELTNVRPDELSIEGLKLFNKINEIIDINKELEEENITLKNVVSEIFNSEDVTENFIPVSLVEEKIEEIKNETWYIDCGVEAKQSCITVLQELLEKRK